MTAGTEPDCLVIDIIILDCNLARHRHAFYGTLHYRRDGEAYARVGSEVTLERYIFKGAYLLADGCHIGGCREVGCHYRCGGYISHDGADIDIESCPLHSEPRYLQIGFTRVISVEDKLRRESHVAETVLLAAVCLVDYFTVGDIEIDLKRRQGCSSQDIFVSKARRGVYLDICLYVAEIGERHGYIAQEIKETEVRHRIIEMLDMGVVAKIHVEIELSVGIA